ncbi:2-polyprenyl-6-methoxyphenol hydroxylase [Gemmatimonadetes bacterium T265]|nr:2-polyprenyl-6-methoxyphenol hydroxylase [Gemmatimonadetes bacterium T265]
MAAPQVLIVGAGPTGLVLALRLARHGVPFRIVDRNAGPAQASRAMAVQARTLEFYRQLGFADAVVAAGIQVEAAHVREGGHDVARVALADMGVGLSPYPFVLCYPQDDHERFLVGQLAAAGVAVEWGVELTAFTQTDAGVRAVLDRGGTAETCGVAYLCGCDGARSRVRETLAVGFPGGTYDQLFYVADVKVAERVPDELYMSLGDDAFALMLPVRSSGTHRFIGVMPPGLAGRTDLTFEDVRPSAEALLGAHAAEVHWFSTYRVHHRVASHFRAGRSFLAGDAGHIHSPAGGQGMNTGIGDAVNLSWKLAHVLQGRAAPSLLDTYEPERIAFARTLVATTDRVFTGVVGRGATGHLVRTWLVPHLLPLLAGFAAVRRAAFETVSQVRLSYHESALSAGRAGDVHGGDRLPWVAADGVDNFAPLGTLDWQLHVYGSVSPALGDGAAALGLAVHGFAWSGAAAAAGLQRDAAYLVRPDGYVALASPEQDVGRLREFVAAHGLRFAGAPALTSHSHNGRLRLGATAPPLGEDRVADEHLGR